MWRISIMWVQRLGRVFSTILFLTRGSDVLIYVWPLYILERWHHHGTNPQPVCSTCDSGPRILRILSIRYFKWGIGFRVILISTPVLISATIMRHHTPLMLRLEYVVNSMFMYVPTIHFLSYFWWVFLTHFGHFGQSGFRVESCNCRCC